MREPVQGATKAKILSQLLMALFVSIGILMGILALGNQQLFRGLMGIGSLAFLLVPLIVKKLGVQYPAKLYMVLFTFLILAYDVGFVYQGYGYIQYYDKIVHFLSGILFTVMGFCLYYYLHRPQATFQENWLVCCTYALFFSLFIAVVWEIGEFTGFLLTGHDSQGTLTTGVFDTMEDLISCLVGSVISMSSFILTIKLRIKLLTGSVAEEFFYACNKK